jgi:Tol biopolymer transport system component
MLEKLSLLMALALITACGYPPLGPVGDAPNTDASMPDASSICDPTGTFDAPVLLTGVNMASNGPPRLTADELELYLSLNTNIYRAQRSTTSEPFGAPIALTQLNTAAQESDPGVSSDGLMLFFDSNRVSGQGYELYVSTRTSRVGEFDAPSQVANVNSATTTVLDVHPFVTVDGQELWFVSTRAGGLGSLDIYRAVWNGSSFANVAAVTALNSNTREYFPTLSADKLTVYLSSDRPGGKGVFDIWTSHRSTTSDGFPAPMLVPELNSSASEYVGWLSPDNCRIYFSSDRSQTLSIYVATRHPL